MSDIPNDVRVAAGNAILAGGKGYEVGGELHLAISKAMLAERERAILAERERCAVVAEALDRRGREWVPDSLWNNIKRDTAAAIRRGQP